MKLKIPEEKKDLYLLIFILVLIFPALFLNLGMLPFILDEATRANVALEMIYSGDFVHTTINGELYLNKPPLFNWLQVISTRLTGSFSENAFRLPTVLSLLLFSITVYRTQKELFGKAAALISALALISCGRILFYDSFRGLIDISFSWMIYLVFWSVYYFGKRRKYFLLFFSSYLFTALAFLMKGMPALVFLGISLLVYFIHQKNFRELFSFRHILAFLFLSLIIAAYLFEFSREIPLKEYVDNLWSESSKRTFLDSSIWLSIRHLFLFPFDFIFHFLPWTLSFILLFRKSNRREIIEHEPSRVFGLFFLANILVYWVSPAIYPRYLFMFLPLYSGILFRLVFKLSQESGEVKFLKYSYLFAGSALIILILGIPFLADKELFNDFYSPYVLLIGLLIILFFLVKKAAQNYLLVTVALLLIGRIAFNFYVIPTRLANETFQKQKNGAVLTGQLSGSVPLKVINGTRIQHASSFYIMRERKEILEFSDGNDDQPCYYIIEKEQRNNYPPHQVLYEFETRIEATRLCLIRFVEE